MSFRDFWNKLFPTPEIWEPAERLVTWDKSRVPLRVSLSSELASYDHCVRDSVSAFNYDCWFKLFQYSGVGLPDDIHITLESIERSDVDPIASCASGRAFVIDPGKPRQRGSIALYGVGDIEAVSYTIRHELGHLVGLCHVTTGQRTVMMPNVADAAQTTPESPNESPFKGPNGAPNPRFMMLTDAQSSALKKRYG